MFILTTNFIRDQVFFQLKLLSHLLGQHSGWLFRNKSHRTTRNIKVELEEKYDSCYLVLWAISWWQGLLLGISRSQGQVWSAEMREASCNAAPRGTTRPEGRSGTWGGNHPSFQTSGETCGTDEMVYLSGTTLNEHARLYSNFRWS